MNDSRYGRRPDAGDATQLRWLLRRGLCTRAGVEKGLDIPDADGDVYDRLYEAIERLALDIRNGNFDPRLYLEGGDEDDEDAENGPDGNVDDAATGDADATDAHVVDVTPFPLEGVRNSPRNRTIRS